jgi:hypothetical protein
MRSLLSALKIDARVSLMESREVVYKLLRQAILHIRAYAGPAERNCEMITELSYLIHNLPDQVETAEREGASFDGFLATMWTSSSDRPLAHGWLAAQLDALGFEISQVLPE